MMLAVMLASALFMTGCGSSSNEPAATEPEAEAPAEETEPEAEAPEETEAADTADTAILVVSFGTSYNDSRDITIGAVEEAIKTAHPDYDVRRAFTAQIIIDKLAERDNLEIDNVTEALDRAVADGVKKLVVQPTHLMDGYEYNDLLDELDNYQEDFESISVGKPLLTSNEDYDAVIGAITKATAEYDDGETAIVFMGHGTEAESNEVYPKMQKTLTDAGLENYYIGTVEAEPSLDDVIAALKEKGTYKKVVLQPLMVVAGDHANNDMAGAEEDSWKSALEKEGYEVTCRLNGLGELAAIRDLYVAHAQAAVDSLSE